MRVDDFVKIVRISKRNGKYRTIYVPAPEEKRELRGIVGELNRKQKKLCDSTVVHGFMPGKSPVTNAMQHIGHKFTVSFDLENFFDTVTPERAQHLSKEQIEKCFVDGAARQGLPTSPAVANLAATVLDKAILKWIQRSGKNVIYTRYADDLAFSFDDPQLIEVVKMKVPEIIKRSGFIVNENKTTCQSSKFGRRIICGVAVGEDNIYPTRETKRRLRAARHQRHHREAHGLEEWCKLRPPKERPERTQDIGSLEELRKHWRLQKINIEKAVANKVQAEADLGESCYITNDPAYFFGMSTFTTGWKSCMAQPSGQYRKGVVGWLALPGTSLAVMLSTKTMSIVGVERRQMRARCLVHQMRDGSRYYDRMYGNPNDTPILAERLKAAGIMPLNRIKGKEERERTVEGYLFGGYILPYRDTLRSKKVKLKSGKTGYKFYL
jgi:RNA-directed DNA polymerase